MAVIVTNGFKKFGSSGPPVLSNFQLFVEPGTIYGLLGPSGCGKTTVLSCIVGLSKLDSGQVRVFGKIPGEKGSGIPGPLIGYMPQETALYPNLTIAEILFHFGSIYGMSNNEIEDRIDFLAHFLQLPDTSRLIRSLRLYIRNTDNTKILMAIREIFDSNLLALLCSGGELRCVSIAATIIHKPPILIVDEATAGLDPELRASIWEYLHALVQHDRRTTIIITTQYIPEANFCDKIGIMRKGRILNEDSPASMLHRFQTRSLENVFLNLCRLDKNLQNNLLNNKIDNNAKAETSGVQLQSVKTISTETESRLKECSFETPEDRVQSDIKIVYTLVKKTILRQVRVPVNVVLLLFIPFLLIFLINGIVGTSPNVFKLGLVTNGWSAAEIGNLNEELLLSKCNDLKSKNINGTCDTDLFEPLTYICAFIDAYPPDKIVWIPTTNEHQALTLVQSGDAIGYVNFPNNFSKHFLDRLIFRNYAEPETVVGSTISFRLDLSNAINSGLLRQLMFKSYLNFLKQSAIWCDADPRMVQLPLKFHSLYDGGSDGLGWNHFIQPASIILIMSVLSNAPGMMTAIEKRLGYLDRDYTAGVKFQHLVISSLCHGSIVIILQLSTTFTFLPLVYGMRSLGPWLLVILLVYLSSLSGVALGFMWGITSRHEMDVVMVLLAVNIAYIGGAGCIWPIEGIAYFYRNFCYLLPVTLPISTLRSIIHRGWDLHQPQIWLGFIGTIFWIVAPIAVAAYFYRRKIRR